MGLLGLLGIKPSAGKVAQVISDELADIIPFYTPQGCFSQLGPVVFSQGGCDCGCSPEFQFFYDKERLGIAPCFFDTDSTDAIKQNKDQFLAAVRNRLGITRVDLVMRGEQPPEYMATYMR